MSALPISYSFDYTTSDIQTMPVYGPDHTIMCMVNIPEGAISGDSGMVALHVQPGK
jgi:hypothetical protein